MRRLILQPAARRSLDAVADFVTEASGRPETGARVADNLLAQCERLAKLPGTLGRPRPELLPELRSFVVGRYLIFFGYRAATLTVINILHFSRDIDAFFTEGP